MQSGGHCARRSSDGGMLMGVSIYSALYISGQKDATRERTMTTICGHEQSVDLQGNGGEGGGEGREMRMQE